MHKTLEFPDLLRLIDERSTAFRAAVAAAPSLDVQVPTCPEWTLFDLVQHLGEGRRKLGRHRRRGARRRSGRAAPRAPRPRPGSARPCWPGWPRRREQLLDALREAGPDRGCWTWWGDSQSPQTCGAVARHQLQEIAVHTYDAQLAVGAPQPLPAEVALDGVDEFLSTCCATTSAWPHEPAVVDYHATEGRSWRLSVDGDGARAARLPARPARTRTRPTPPPAARPVSWSCLYGRIPLDSLQLDGDPGCSTCSTPGTGGRDDTPPLIQRVRSQMMVEIRWIPAW